MVGKHKLSWPLCPLVISLSSPEVWLALVGVLHTASYGFIEHQTCVDRMDTSSEKANVERIDDTTAYPIDSNVSESDHEFTSDEQKRIIRRIDRRLVTTLGFMYCVSLMDRTNLGFANIAGMSTELVLIGERYVSINNSGVLVWDRMRADLSNNKKKSP